MSRGSEERVGYGRPPTSTQFRKGQSGNPRGRPRKRHREIPYDGVLAQMVTIREDGRERRVTAAEAFMLNLTQQGLAGDSAAARASLEAIEAARARQPDYAGPTTIVLTVTGLGAAGALKSLGIAYKRNPRNKERVRWELNPWILEAALERLGDRQLTEEEQREVWANTRTPHKINWPKWWSVKG